MNSGRPPGLENLTNLGLRGDVDMRPTLLRVLTDLYVQKLTHTPDEERHYTELALRLLDSVDVATRTAVATRLARHLTPPRRVIERLAGDLPGIAEPLRAHPLLGAEAAPPVATPVEKKPPAAVPSSAALHDADRRDADHRANGRARPPADLDAAIAGAVAGELTELFFAANAEERRLILLNIEIAVPSPAGRVSLVRDPAAALRIERAALAQDREGFALQLAQALMIPHMLALRIAGDKLGEPIIVAAKALAMRRDLVYRILLFVNTAVGHYVERVRALATLYDEMPTQAAEHMISIWQGLQMPERKAARHQPLLYDDGRAPARATTPTLRRAPARQRSSDRRNAS